MSWSSFIESVAVSLIATAVVFGILWVLSRRHLLTLRPIVVPVVQRRRALSAGLRSIVHRAGRRLRFRTVKQEMAGTRFATYKDWDNKLPMTKKVLEQVIGLARSNEPFFGVLVSTHPPTIKMTKNGPMPIVTRLVAVNNLDPSSFNGIAHEDLVATFHTHRLRLDVLEHDERLFRVVDAFAGPKIHIIGSVKGLQLYCARSSPVVIKRDSKLEVR